MSMLSNSLKNLVSKPATRLYPYVEADIQPNCRGRIEFDMSKCIFCMMCSRRCPCFAIETDKAAKTHTVYRMRCIACGACIDACPTDTITMRQHYQEPGYAPIIDVYTATETAGDRDKAKLEPVTPAPICDVPIAQVREQEQARKGK